MGDRRPADTWVDTGIWIAKSDIHPATWIGCSDPFEGEIFGSMCAGPLGVVKRFIEKQIKDDAFDFQWKARLDGKVQECWIVPFTE